MSQENLFNGIFKDKIVLLTGHTGFQGSWLALWLKLLGAKVIGYALEPPTNPSLFETLELKNDLVDIVADIRDKKKISDSLNKYQPEFVFHLAAQALVRPSYEKPPETFETNIMGTVNVLESVRHCKSVKSCLIITSDKCYENRIQTKPHKEDDPMGGFDPYSSSKGAAELVTKAYRNSFFSNNVHEHAEIATIRAGNVLGGGDWAKDRIVPDIIRSIEQNEKIHLRNPNFFRPWQYVLEPLSGILWLAAKMYQTPKKFSEAWNFGPRLDKKFLTVREITNIIIEKWGSSLSLEVKENSNNMYESESLIIDSSKSKKYLDWENTYTIDEALTETVLWYKKFKNDKSDMKKISTTQIENYILRAHEKNLIWTK